MFSLADTRPPMLEDPKHLLSALSLEEDMRVEKGFCFVDVPYKDSKHKYICPKCFAEIFGKE